MIPRRRPFKGPGLILALGCLVPAVWAGEGSIVRIGPCVNPDCNVTPPNSGFKGVATGNYHTMGLRSNGSVAAWGMCDVDQCTLPIPNTGFVAVAAGDSFSLGLKSDGTLVAWGSFDQDDIPQPNRGYLAMTANRGLGDAVRAPAPDGTFSAAPPISTSGLQTPTAIAADVDGDGDQDIVAAEYGANLVALYENNGTVPPIWTKRIIDASAFGPITVAVADLDGDGDTDVLSANFNEEGIVWYENKGGSPPAWTKRLISGIPGAYGDGDLDAVGGETMTETAVPAAGRGFYYLVRAENACGAGTYGASTQAVERTSTACR